MNERLAATGSQISFVRRQLALHFTVADSCPAAAGPLSLHNSGTTL